MFHQRIKFSQCRAAVDTVHRHFNPFFQVFCRTTRHDPGSSVQQHNIALAAVHLAAKQSPRDCGVLLWVAAEQIFSLARLEAQRLRVRLDRILSSLPARLWYRIAGLPLVRSIVAHRTADYLAAVERSRGDFESEADQQHCDAGEQEWRIE